MFFIRRYIFGSWVIFRFFIVFDFIYLREKNYYSFIIEDIYDLFFGVYFLEFFNFL